LELLRKKIYGKIKKNMKNKGKYRRNRNVDFYRYNDAQETIQLLGEKIARF